MDSNARSQNGFLKSLNTDDFEAILPHLRTAELTQGQVLQDCGAPIEDVYFPHDCVLSRVMELDAGEIVQIFMVGPDSMLGALAAAGLATGNFGTAVVLPGFASIINVDRLRATAKRSVSLSRALSRHGQSVMIQSQQSVTCKAMHAVEARLARWLLEVRDLSGNDRFTMTQEMMAQMIGARSNSISIVAHTLEQEDCISYSRGYVEITDPIRLGKIACKCYSAIRAQHESLLRDTERSFACGEVSY
jgi:CRP-like cAMP-binding protein